MLQRLNPDFHRSPKGGGNFLFRLRSNLLLVFLSRRENSALTYFQWLVSRSDSMQRLLPLRSEGFGGGGIARLLAKR